MKVYGERNLRKERNMDECLNNDVDVISTNRKAS